MSVNFLHFALFAIGAGLLFVGVATVWSIVSRRRREQRDIDRMREAKEVGLDLPTSLLPVIDPALCSGCLSCLDVCPEGDLFGVKAGKAVMIEPARCIGHSICVDACPTGAISLVFGSKERGIDLPETNELFETARPGMHVVGELGGIGLINNALKQGLDVAKALKEQIDEQKNGGKPVEKDVAIIGAGPAGIACAVGCRAMGLSFRIVDQASVGGAIAAYPRQKLVMIEPVKLPLYGSLPGETSVSKEELMDHIGKLLTKAGVSVHENVKALDVKGEDGRFSVVTDHGFFEARKVVLALGRRGSPRQLGVPGEESAKVTYSLVDPTQYKGKRVLVVGGGDVAAESVIMLGDEGVDVTMSYRRNSLQRCRKKNRQKVEKLVDKGRVKMMMPSQVVEIREDRVVLDCDGQKEMVPNDFVIVNIGGTSPDAFLEKLGVTMKKYAGEALPRMKRSLRDSGEESPWAPLMNWTLSALGVAAIFALAIYGWDYYWSPRVERIQSPLHEALRPSGPWGHGLGVLATVMMMINFAYSAHKRRGWFGFISLSGWMRLHVFFGIFSSLLVAFHSAFQSNNLVATVTTAATAVVFMTGLIGRYLYALLPINAGHLASLASLKEKQKVLQKEMLALALRGNDPTKTQTVALNAGQVLPAKGTLVQHFVKLPANYFQFRREAADLAGAFVDKDDYRRFRTLYLDQMRLRLQIIFYNSMNRFMSGWRVLHVSLACMLVVLIVAHIGISLYLGFGWILF